MKQEDKELLLKDLCARLPYGVIGFYTAKGWKDACSVLSANIINNIIEGLSFKPYLFPLSSMTEEQREEYNSICDMSGFDMSELDADKLIAFFHKNHIDYRGLIDKGLAINATNLNIY